MPEVQTGRLLLRRWQDDDRERLVALFADPRVSQFLSHHGRPWPRERSLEVFEHFVRQWEEHGFGRGRPSTRQPAAGSGRSG